MSLRIVFTILACSAAFPGFILASSCFRRRAATGAVEFAIFILGCSIYALGYVGELWSEKLQLALFWSRVEYAGIAAIPTAWIAFVTAYTGRRLPREAVLGLAALSAATFAIVLTMHLHGLYYVNPRFDHSGPFPTLSFGKGPWYWAFVVYIWLCLFIGELLLLRFFFSMRSIFKMQTGIAFFGAFLPFLANTAYFFGLVPDHIDPTPLTMPLFAVPLAISLLKYHFLDVMPIARERVFEAISDGVVVVNPEGRIIDANGAAERLLGIGPNGAGRRIEEAGPADYGLRRLVSTGDRLEFSREPMGAASLDGLASRDGPASQDGPASHDGTRHFEARACPVGEGRGDIGTVILVSDVTETKRLMARLDELASKDYLTGLYNRRFFFEVAQRELQQAVRTGRQLSVCVADIDRFKDVNDKFGHAMGDAALQAAAERLSACLRTTDIICRYGGEEFALFFPDCALADGKRVAERLRAGLAAEPVRKDGLEIRITGSFGVFGGIPQRGQGLEQFLNKADEAMYAAKRAGRNRVCAPDEGGAIPAGAVPPRA